MEYSCSNKGHVERNRAMISCGEPDENNLLANRWIVGVPRKGFHATCSTIPVSFSRRLETIS